MPKETIRKPQYWYNTGEEAHYSPEIAAEYIASSTGVGSTRVTAPDSIRTFDKPFVPLEDLLPITVTGSEISLGWSDDTVQLTAVDYDDGNKVVLELSRRELNHMLIQLRTARDKAFGRDV